MDIRTLITQSTAQNVRSYERYYEAQACADFPLPGGEYTVRGQAATGNRFLWTLHRNPIGPFSMCLFEHLPERGALRGENPDVPAEWLALLGQPSAEETHFYWVQAQPPRYELVHASGSDRAVALADPWRVSSVWTLWQHAEDEKQAMECNS